VQILQVARRQDLLSRTGPLFASSLWVASRIAVVHSLHIQHAGLGSSFEAFSPAHSSLTTRSLPSSPSRLLAPSSPRGSFMDIQANALLSGLQALGESWSMASRYANVLSRLLDNCRFDNINVNEWTNVIADMVQSERDVESLYPKRAIPTIPPPPTSSINGRSRRLSCAAAPSLSLVREMIGAGSNHHLFNPRLPNGFDRILTPRS
jgi:hypothetical protein